MAWAASPMASRPGFHHCFNRSMRTCNRLTSSQLPISRIRSAGRGETRREPCCEIFQIPIFDSLKGIATGQYSRTASNRRDQSARSLGVARHGPWFRRDRLACLESFIQTTSLGLPKLSTQDPPFPDHGMTPIGSNDQICFQGHSAFRCFQLQTVHTARILQHLRHLRIHQQAEIGIAREAWR